MQSEMDKIVIKNFTLKLDEAEATLLKMMLRKLTNRCSDLSVRENSLIDGLESALYSAGKGIKDEETSFTS